MKLFVLTRRDLSPEQRSVQSGHALAEFLLRYKTHWDNGTLIYLGVKNEDELKRWMFKLDNSNIRYSVFREPDIGNEITSLATDWNGTKIFRSLDLL